MVLQVRQMGGWYDKQRIMRFLRNDYDNFYLLFDLENYNFLMGNSQFYFARDGSDMSGVMLIYYHSSGVKDIWFSGNDESFDLLLRNIDRSKSLVHMRFNGNLKFFDDADRIYHEYCMVVDKPNGEKDKSVMLLSADAHQQYGQLMSQWQGTRFPSMGKEEFRNLLTYSTVYGYYDGENLASAATLGAVWKDWFVISSVFTDPRYRNRGYAGKVISTIMSNYNHLSKGILYVNKENPAAINVYRKLGFKVYSEELWVDYGTGLVP